MTDRRVLDRIVDHARNDPDHSAARDLDRELSYAQLIDEAARVGAGLLARGVTAGDRVALLIPNSVDFIVAALASMWIGAIFVPLAITDPLARLQIIVADCSPALVVTATHRDNQAYASFRNALPTPLSSLRREQPAPIVGNDEARVAYMIYTSGTTGTPKGVQIGHDAFAAAVQATANVLGLSEATRTLCVSPFHFDGSYANLFPTLVSGGTVVLRPRDALLFPRAFFKAVASEEITYAGFTPSYLRLLVTSPQMSTLAGSTLKMVAMGGETVSVADLRTLWSFAPAMRVFTRYGPTETAIAVSHAELTPAMIDEGSVTIGRPHPGVSFILADDDGQVITGQQQMGELCIGGVQLMEGYWANPALTREVMRTDIVPAETLYRTGDLVYRNGDGNYFFVGRTDRVVKRNGVRISLVELSESMNQLGEVAAAACLTFDREGELGIVAFVTVEATTSVLDLRRAASKYIPETMMPDRIEIVPAMPLNKSNKLDEHQLLSAAGLRPYQTQTPGHSVHREPSSAAAPHAGGSHSDKI